MIKHWVDGSEKKQDLRLEGHLDQKTARTIQIMHEYRNEVYHIGLQHEGTLPDLAEFYFDTACKFIATYKSREVKRLKELEDENAKLKKLLAEAMVDKDALQTLLAKKW